MMVPVICQTTTVYYVNCVHQNASPGAKSAPYNVFFIQLLGNTGNSWNGNSKDIIEASNNSA